MSLKGDRVELDHYDQDLNHDADDKHHLTTSFNSKGQPWHLLGLPILSFRAESAMRISKMCATDFFFRILNHSEYNFKTCI